MNQRRLQAAIQAALGDAMVALGNELWSGIEARALAVVERYTDPERHRAGRAGGGQPRRQPDGRAGERLGAAVQRRSNSASPDLDQLRHGRHV